MARPYNDKLRELAAQAVMREAGFVDRSSETLLTQAARGNPRVAGWVATADAVPAVVFPRRADRRQVQNNGR